jgi:RHS repeat-associated protein
MMQGGNQLTVRDPNSVGADMVYDSLGRNTQRTDTFGDVTKTDYDRAGNAVKQTDAKNKYTLISFDPRNRRKSTTDRISAGTTFTYLATGLLASLTDAESQTTAYTYDARGSKLTEQYPDHSSGATVGQTGYGIVTFVYDKAGRVLRKQDQAGDTCTYNFDLAGRMTSRNYRTAANSPTGTIADTDTFTFDRSGRMLTAVSGRYNNTVGYAFDPVGRKASESLTIASQTYTVGSEFNARNELVKYTYPDSSIANRAYTARGALSELKLDSSVIDTRSYDDGGRMTTDVLGNGITETRAYRTDNLLSTISFSNTNIGNLTYSWDANKNKTAETIGGVMSGYGFTSAGTAYDDEDRLTGYQQASTNFNQSWSLTSVGDWSSVTTNGTAVTRTHGPTHELLTSGGQNVTTDVKGNQTVLPASLATQAAQLAFAWDYDNKLKSSDIDNNGSADVTFEYDALGRRVARTEGSTAVVYFQADQQTIADYPRGGAASTATYRYVFASYIDEPVVRKTTGTSGTVLYYHRNQQYSIVALTDSSGAVSERYAYTAYGHPTFLNASATVQTSSAAGNRYTYTAREWDATLGLHHFRARWMSGLTGRFLTRDPIGFRGSPYDLYEYCESGPLRFRDPMGMACGPDDFDKCIQACGNQAAICFGLATAGCIGDALLCNYLLWSPPLHGACLIAATFQCLAKMYLCAYNGHRCTEACKAKYGGPADPGNPTGPVGVA